VNASDAKMANRTIWADTAGGNSGIHFGGGVVLPALNGSPSKAGTIDFGGGDYQWNNAYFSGTVYSKGSPLTRTVDLIKTLSTLRNATKDETTLEGMRDALSDAIGGIIQDLEHQISTMPAEDSNE
jgi:hypothetical protein